MRVEPIAWNETAWAAASAYVHGHFDRALLVAADMTDALRTRSTLVRATDGERTIGVAARFTGFVVPSVTVAADDSVVAWRLLEAVGAADAMLSVAAHQPLPVDCDSLDWTVDPWLCAPCRLDTDAERACQRVTDVDELQAFYSRLDVAHWCREMSELSYVVREASCIVSAVSVQFRASSAGYAQIGALVTEPGSRGRGLARTLMAAVASGLLRAGVPRCGVFAEAAYPWLVEFYERQGFTRAGSFRFAKLDSAPQPRRDTVAV